jgi:hypothetical protein
VSLSGLSILENDEVFVFVGTGGTSADRLMGTSSSGWTSLVTTIVQDDSQDANLLAFRKRMGATPDTTIDITSGNPSTTTAGSTAVIVVVLRNVDATTPVDVAAVAVGGIDSSYANPGSVTPVSSGVLLMAVSAIAFAPVGVTVVNPGLDMQRLNGIAGFAGQVNHVAMAVATKKVFTSGAFDPSIWDYRVDGVTQNINTSSWGAITLAIKGATNSTVRNGSANVSVNFTLAATGTAPANATAEVTLPFTLAATGRAPATGQAAISLGFTLAATGTVIAGLTATGITAGAPAVGSPALGQIHVLSATGIAAGAPAVGSPALARILNLTATGIAAGALAVGSPSMGVISNLTATGIASGSPVVGSPSLTESAPPSVVNFPSPPQLALRVPVVEAPALGIIHNLSASNLASGIPVVGTPGMVVIRALESVSIQSGTPVVGTLSMGVIRNLTAVSIVTGAPVVGVPTMAMIHVLIALGISAGVWTLTGPRPALSQRARARREAYPNESENRGVLLNVLLSDIGIGERTTSGIILNPENSGKIV